MKISKWKWTIYLPNKSKKKNMFNLNKLPFYINNYIYQTRISLARKHFRQNVFSFLFGPILS